MNILLTGATGFIGQHLVPRLLKQGHSLTLIVRDIARLKSSPWIEQVNVCVADVHQQDLSYLKRLANHDVLIHLAWPGLPNYKAAFHMESNFPADYRFLRTLVEQGIKQILITGTCLEYGLQSGCLGEDSVAKPNVAYALAKDSLRKNLQQLQQQSPFVLQWARLFYIYGQGQSEHSFLSQLDRAIKSRQVQFNMSAGEQLRDYLAVEKVADYLLAIVECQNCDGVVNVCSGQPISIRTLAEQYIEQQQAEIQLNLGYYPYPDYESMAFWGNPQKLQNWLKAGSK